METFFWHDYETWGLNTWVDRPVQFAGVRTDLDLNVISEPLVLYCKPPPDLLPHPKACLTHGITPQQALANGVLEYQFIAAIHQEMSKTNTCNVGYKSIDYDDHITRHLLYRNFYDPYQREYQDGNSRWDIIDMVRACYALRPEGIEWPLNENGKPSFRLEDIASANGLSHEKCHDALSDVYATIDMARMIKCKQPRLFDYLYKLRNKREVEKLINLNEKKPVLHISDKFSTEHGCAALVMPLAIHPTNKNEIICYNLSIDPIPFIELSAYEVWERVFSTSEDLIVNNIDRIPLKSIRINYCPVVCNEKVLDDTIAQRLKIDRDLCESNYKKLVAVQGLTEKLNDIFSNPDWTEITDPEQMLYSGGFIKDVDKASVYQVRTANTLELEKMQFHFQDKRLPELLFRYRARNFHETLTADEQNKWAQFCYQRLTDPNFGASIVLDDYKKELLRLESEKPQDEKCKELLIQLSQHIQALL